MLLSTSIKQTMVDFKGMGERSTYLTPFPSWQIIITEPNACLTIRNTGVFCQNITFISRQKLFTPILVEYGERKKSNRFIDVRFTEKYRILMENVSSLKLTIMRGKICVKECLAFTLTKRYGSHRHIFKLNGYHNTCCSEKVAKKTKIRLIYINYL